MSRSKNNCSVSRVTKVTVIVLTGITFAILMSYYALGQKHSASTLRMAAILFRHGEKNPTSFYPNDLYAQNEWAGGLGSLTMKGSLQAYNLGNNLRLRYHTVLPKNGIYSQQDMYVLSSYAERCIMSAQALLAGLMPTTEDNSMLPIRWQPVPVTSIPRLEDTLIAQKKPCARYEDVLQQLYLNPPPDLAQLNAKNIELYNNLTLYTGKSISNVLDVELLYNTLKAESDIGLSLPQWTQGIYPERLLPLAERSYTLFTDNNLMKRIKGGAFLGEVSKNMINKAANTLQPDRKLFLYSGHDVTLVNVMNSIGILDQTSKLPDYASALVFELHDHPEFPQNYEVRMVYYSNSEVDFPSPIMIPNCSTPCTLENFTAAIHGLLFDDYNEICENTEKC